MKAVTGNRLDSGAVVYWRGDGSWTEEIGEAARYAEDAAPGALEVALAQSDVVAEAYLIELGEMGAPAGRAALRETIRRDGPTVRRDLGRQAGRG